ncbi:hypothetical protein AJ79_02389 [Helicocarpus griseus UAMH5409]|uniref:Protein kinase domain-containing protein n=1 Tax=Helicocarpus griseus UAMH5409 TaxID=1447875 RepID=A0A2B7Y310_9EURO|nr:hypothetical protein AJ79_02389 [Helicocarpus griseus UAMH5409]
MLVDQGGRFTYKSLVGHQKEKLDDFGAFLPSIHSKCYKKQFRLCPSDEVLYQPNETLHQSNDIFSSTSARLRSPPVVPSKVTVKSNISGMQQPYYFVHVYSHEAKATEKALGAHLKIGTSGFDEFDDSFRILPLEAVVYDNGHVMGVLLKYIQCYDSLEGICSRNPDPSHVKKWIPQISQTLKRLHQQYQIVWGDVRAANVLIDMHGDVRLILFKGAFCAEHLNRAGEICSYGKRHWGD